MKRLTSVILAVALALSALGVLGARIYQKVAYGGAAPEIAFAADVLEVPTGADDAALLAGVTATDAEDGDVTASLLVEGVSGRNADGTVQVTYAAFDSDRHVTKATRAVRYTDYKPPRFALSQPLVCRVGAAPRALCPGKAADHGGQRGRLAPAGAGAHRTDEAV